VSATEEHAQEAVSHVQEESGAGHLIKTHNVDLGDLAVVKSLFTTLADSLERLDQLYLIAGIGVGPFGYTKDGLGNHFGVNNVAQVLIIDLLYTKLVETAKKVQGTADEGSVRIVSESSEMHRTAPSDVKAESLNEFGKDSEDMSPVALYGRSKLGKCV
jgi:NAD(P)-dependent dehydrogenase (short-subunit alcohol dehydrogenase family)